MGTYYFCQKHHDELAAKFGGDARRAYPGEEIVIDAVKCDALDCLTDRIAGRKLIARDKVDEACHDIMATVLDLVSNDALEDIIGKCRVCLRERRKAVKEEKGG